MMSNLLTYGVVRHKLDPCILRSTSLAKKRLRLISVVHMDGLIVTEEAKYFEDLRTHLPNVCPTKNLGAVYYYTGRKYL